MLRFVFASLSALLFAGNAFAIILPCSLMRQVGTEPLHVQANEEVGFRATIAFAGVGSYTGPPQVVISKSLPGPNQQIALDVVITTQPALFPGYEMETVETNPSSVVAHGPLGSFAVGQYTITATVRYHDAATGTFTSPCDDWGGPLIVYPDSGRSPVVEYYLSGFDHYFMTQDENEIRVLDAGTFPGWVRTGQSFFAYRPGQGAGQPIIRYYKLPGASTHFYTFGASGEDFAMRVGELSFDWDPETLDAFDLFQPDATTGSCPESTVPVYRFWNGQPEVNHRYTSDPAIRQEMLNRGWIAEGYGPDAVFMCAPASG